MATLLHLDSAVFPQGSASRDITTAFVQAWQEQHPEGTVVYRDLAAAPCPIWTSPPSPQASTTPCAPSSPPSSKRQTPC